LNRFQRSLLVVNLPSSVISWCGLGVQPETVSSPARIPVPRMLILAAAGAA
jgi:hypothetical protein